MNNVRMSRKPRALMFMRDKKRVLENKHDTSHLRNMRLFNIRGEALNELQARIQNAFVASDNNFDLIIDTLKNIDSIINTKEK